jgi:SAM-dependent methyltransferase
MLCGSLAVVGALAQTPRAPEQFQPFAGQDGKDVIWIPTAHTLVERMLDLARVTPSDYLIDLGSGDGRLVIAAAKRGARALGIEYNPDMVKVAETNAASEGVSDRARFTKADLFDSDFSRATVVTMFLLPDLNLKLRPKLLRLNPGTRIVSNTFTMGAWLADETVSVSNGCTSWCTALLWVVPARVAGTWRLARGELILRQEFQLIAGTLTSEGGSSPITGGVLRGDRIRFGVGALQYAGLVTADEIKGTVKSGGGEQAWTATRAEPSLSSGR